jgi:ubiquinone/menaquinone biosynthesis C-methylase UbiE
VVQDLPPISTKCIGAVRGISRELGEESMTDNAAPIQLEWDYTEHASHYDKRADYSYEAIQELLTTIGCTPGTLVADLGAGTGKLTKELLRYGLRVRSVEPNQAMREIGMRNTCGLAAEWSAGTGEATGLPSASFRAVLFGSSFNVVDQHAALREVRRLLVPDGWLACMWNHRDLDDPVQLKVESIIKAAIPGYSYGSRREDPRGVIDASGYFLPARALERSFSCRMRPADIVEAWRSHATLKRQAHSEASFRQIIEQISRYLEQLPEHIDVPYTTRIYFARLRDAVA